MEYRLPATVRDRLGSALAGRRNKDACLTFATFVARYWSAPRKLGLPFALDRRALAAVEALGLSEGRVRGALRTLQQAGFLERLPCTGRTHQRTPDGLHRRPVSYVIAPDYRAAFDAANNRAAAARDRRSQDRRGSTLAVAQRPPVAFPMAPPTSYPKWSPSQAVRCIWDRTGAKALQPAEPNSKLEAALARWGKALRERAG